MQKPPTPQTPSTLSWARRCSPALSTSQRQAVVDGPRPAAKLSPWFSAKLFGSPCDGIESGQRLLTKCFISPRANLTSSALSGLFTWLGVWFLAIQHFLRVDATLFLRGTFPWGKYCRQLSIVSIFQLKGGGGVYIFIKERDRVYGSTSPPTSRCAAGALHHMTPTPQNTTR